MRTCDTSRIEIDRDAYFENIKFIKNRLHNQARLSSVVKGNAYGHGIRQIIPLAEEAGIDHFSVFSVNEARQVCKFRSKRSDLMIMGWISSSDFPWVIEEELEFFVYDLDIFNIALQAARKKQKSIKIHLELETGLNRTGLNVKNLQSVIELIKNHSDLIEVVGVCTHYAGSESLANHVRVKHQLKKFNQLTRHLEKHGITPRYRHTACSASVINYPQTHMDLVRVGIMQYGYWPNIETRIRYLQKRDLKTDPLKRIISWLSQVMSVKEVLMGEYISYGSTYLVQEDKIIAIVPVGYSMGYRRNLSNYGIVLIHGQRANVVGLVNMNMMIVDITHIEGVIRGDEVVLIGNSGDQEISVSSFSEMSHMLNYESLTRLPENITRKIV